MSGYFGIPLRNGLPLGLGTVISLRSGASWTPLTLFLAGEQGGWYDPTDLTTMFQDSAGTTPVTAVEQPVGLWLDKRLGALSAQQYDPATVPTASFDGNGAVTVARSGASLTFTSAANGDGIRLNGFNAAAGDVFTYVEFTASGSGTLAVFAGNVQTTFTLTASPTTYRATTCPNIAGFATPIFRALSAGFNAQITITSIRALRGNHLIQPTSASRPTYSKRYNVLTRTEQFDNAAWDKPNVTAVSNQAVAPNGTTTADLIYPTTSGNDRGTFQTATFPANTPLTFTTWVRNAGKNFVAFARFSGAGYAVWVDLTTGATSNLAAGYTASTIASANGWTVTITGPASATTYIQPTICDAAGSVAVTTNGTDGVYIWGADLRRTIHTQMGMPSYQRVTTATDYDESGFLPRLRFDGADDSMYSAASVDFTATDEMTVLTGLTKLSDAATGIFVELSIQADTNNGAFYLRAPNGATDTYDFLSRGTLPARVTPTGFSAPILKVVACVADIGGDIAQIRIDGVVRTTDTSNQGTGNFGNYPLYVGRRANSAAPFNGDIFQLIVRGALTSGATLTSAEQYVAARTGVTLP